MYLVLCEAKPKNQYNVTKEPKQGFRSIGHYSNKHATLERKRVWLMLVWSVPTLLSEVLLLALYIMF